VLGSTVALHARLATSLRERLRDGEWASGDQLPTEAELSAEYGVSRSTVRAALVQLENQGLTVTRHGLGTFVTPFGRAIKAGLQELQSMTDTIVAHGMEPRIDYRSAEVREATEEERAALEREAPGRVLATTRAVHADDLLVAFSYEAIPMDLLPADLDPATVRGSLFALLESSGAVPRTAVAGVHARRGKDIGWGERPRAATYLLLQQVHYDGQAVPLLFSKTYFVEGRFQFSILRVR
jgi:GntR family transcriptional regulator